MIAEQRNTPHAMTARRWVLPGIVLFLYLAILVGIVLILPEGSMESLRSFLVQYVLGRDYIIANDQKFGDTYTVSKVRLTHPGFLVLTIANQFGTPGEYTLGFSADLSAGTHTNVPITIQQDFLDQVMQDVGVRRHDSFVVLYDDNGLPVGTLGNKVVTDIYGQPVTAHVNVY